MTTMDDHMTKSVFHSAQLTHSSLLAVDISVPCQMHPPTPPQQPGVCTVRPLSTDPGTEGRESDVESEPRAREVNEGGTEGAYIFGEGR